MTDAKLNVEASVDNQASGPLKEAAEAFKAAAVSVIESNEKIASASQAAAEKHGAHAAEMGHAAGVAAELTEKLVELGERALELPLEAFRELKEAVLDTAKAQDAAYVASQRLGVSSEIFTALAMKAKETGGSAETLEKAMFKVAVAADEGGKKWDKWGISVRDADGALKDKQQLLEDVVTKYASLGDEVQRDTFLTDTLSKSARELTPFIKELAEGGFEEAIEKASKFHAVITDADAKLGHDFTRSLGETKEAFEGLEREVAEAFEPTMIKVFGAVSDALAETADKAEDSRDALQHLVTDGAVKVIDGVEKTIVVLDALNQKFAGVEESVDKVNKALSYLNPLQSFSKFADDLGFVAEQTGIVTKSQEGMSAETKELVDRLEGLKASLKDAAAADDDYADGAVINADKRKKSFGTTHGEDEKAKAAAAAALKAHEEEARVNEYWDQQELEADKKFSEQKKKIVESEAGFRFEQQKEAIEDEKKKKQELWDKEAEANDQRQASAEKLAHTIDNQVGGAFRTLVSDMLHGKNAMDDLLAVAENFGVSLAEDLVKAEALKGIETAVSGIQGAFGNIFGGLFGGAGGAGGGDAISEAFSEIEKIAPAAALAAEGGIVDNGEVVRMGSGGILDGPGPIGVDSINVRAAPGEAFIPAGLTSELRRVLSVSGGSHYADGGVVGGFGGGDIHVHLYMPPSAIPPNATDMSRGLRWGLADQITDLARNGQLDKVRNLFNRVTT